MVAMEFGVELEVAAARNALESLREEFEQRTREHLEHRPPVVTFLGHVDHGKTSLLDRIRKTEVAEGEEGGITQHVGAYQVATDGLSVTFLDTPGHAAFTAMRARGANLTDVVVLVVAADDGVMPQTVEAINHARAANVPIVVALNKIDLPSSDVNRVYGQLAENDLTPTEWGGQTDVIKTSAATGEGIDSLIEHLAALSELLELKADAAVPASGTVIEAQMRDGVGPTARVLVQEGTLEVGDVVVCGPAAGRVRSMMDHRGKAITAAVPGTPVEIAGLDEVPDAGEQLYQIDDLARAKQIAEEVRQERRAASLASSAAAPTDLASMLAARAAGEVPHLTCIVRADVRGSVDVIKKTLGELPSDEVKLTILHAAVGGITESDVLLAEASDAIVIGFHVVAEPAAERLAEERGVDIRLYRVIYEMTDEIRQALEGMLQPERQFESRSRLEVREVFNISRVGTIAGCYVTTGTIRRDHHVRVLRDNVVVYPREEGKDGQLDSLKRFKDDAREVRAGLECGVKIANFDDVHLGDVIESYEIVEVARKLAPVG